MAKATIDFFPNSTLPAALSVDAVFESSCTGMYTAVLRSASPPNLLGIASFKRSLINFFTPTPAKKNLIIIYWNNHNELAHRWRQLTPSGEYITPWRHDSLADIAAQAQDSQVIMAVSGLDVTLLALNVPDVRRHQLNKLLPLAVEDDVLAPIDTLHLCPAATREAGQLPVAIVAKEKMQHWLNACREHTLDVIALIPAILAIPHAEGTWTVFDDGHSITVRTGLFSGFACHQKNFKQLLALQLAQQQHTIHSLHYYSLAQEPPIIEDVAGEITVLVHSGEQLDCAQLLHQKNTINLLQGEFALNPKKPQYKKLWQIAAGIFIALGLFFLINLLSQYVYLSQKNNTLEEQLFSIYKKYFPQATHMVAPQSRLQQQLNSRTADSNMYLRLLSIAGDVIKDFHGAAIQTISYKKGELLLSITATDFELLREINNALQQTGLQITQQAATNHSEQLVNATFLIKEVHHE